MSDLKAKLADKGFCNWIKANLAISDTKAGLEESVCTKLKTVHRDVLNDIRTDDQIRSNFCCFCCATQNVIRCSRIHPCNQAAKVCPFHKQTQYRECPNGICGQIRDKIIQAHVHKTPSWKNTRAEAWGNSYWEYAKCFMPPDGYADKNSFLETDFNGIINILTNHRVFASQIDKSICKEARNIVNDVRHNSDLAVSDQQLEDIVTVLKQLLSCCEEFKNSSQASRAILKLEKLKDDSLSITEWDVKHCLRKQYDDLIKDLKADLIQFNKDQHGTTSISPVLEEMDSPLLELFVAPTINKVHSGVPNRRTTRVETFQDMFFGSGSRYREIYLCADTGVGKTVYAKRLTLMWCQANEADQNECNFTQEEIDVMKRFGFVFFVSLKESDQIHRDVDDMIEQQIIRNLARASSYKTEFIEKVLTHENCLIILDGLDEWSYATEHIPHRKSRQTCTFFTTTRHWKFTIAKIRQSKIDQQLEMTGIDAAGKQKLMSNVLKNMMGDEADNKSVSQLKDFDAEVAKRNIAEFETSPMLLLYLICLWLDKKPLGDSRCSLYSNIVEMLLQKFATKEQIVPKLMEETKNMPKCFREKEYCCKYFTFIKALSYLAFITLFNPNTENKFVFADTIAKKNVSEQCIDFWLRVGILTQIKARRRLTAYDIKVSFIHKTFHEFFAALHIALREPEDVTEVTDVVGKACPDLNSFLQNANSFEFLCGLSPTASSKVLGSLVALLAKDELTQRLRSNTYAFLDYWDICDLKQDFQNMMVACVNESKDNGYTPDYHLEDIFLNFGSETEKRYVDALCDLTAHRKVKWIKFGEYLAPEKVHELRKTLNVQNMKSLQKLELWGHPRTEDVDVLLTASVETLTCLLVHGCRTTADEKHIEVSEESYNTLHSMDNLNCVDLFRITLKHELIEKLLKLLEWKKSMCQIKVARLKCSDHHSDNCQSYDFVLDLSEHKNLKVIGLGNICVSRVKVNSLALEEFWAECNDSIVTSFLTSYVPLASNLHTFVVEFIDSIATVEQILNTLPHLDSLCYLQLKRMDVQERELTFTSQQTVTHLRLIEIAMQTRALKKLIEEFGTYSRPVTVEIASCVFKPGYRNENVSFEKLRDMILVSDKKFTVIANAKCSGHDNAFAFRTIPA